MNNIIETLGGMLRPASDLSRVEVIPTSIKPINDIVFYCGGIPRGRITEILAEESQGKSTFAQWLVSETQKQGGKAIWVDAEKTFDKNYAEKSGVDIANLSMLDFSFAQDLFYKIKLIFAYNMFDIVVVDSVNSVLPAELADAKIESLSMNERLISAKIWSSFFYTLEGGYRIKDLNTGKLVKSNVITNIINEKKLVQEEDEYIHKISQKKTALILINHKNPKVGVQFGTKWYTPGGKRKDFAYSIRLDISRKKTETGQVAGVKNVLKYRIIEVRAVKNKVGIPLGTTQLKMDKDGRIFPLDEQDVEELKEVELVDEIQKISDEEIEVEGSAFDKLSKKLQ